MKLTDQPAVASPCINQCKILDSTGLCQGCWRSIDEIMAWSTASDPKKRQIWENIAVRKSAAGKISTPN